MFKKKKHKEEQLKLIQKEKQELLRLKEILEDNYPKIDLKDIYVLTVDDINYIVRMQVEEKIGVDYFKNREREIEYSVISRGTEKSGSKGYMSISKKIDGSRYLLVQDQWMNLMFSLLWRSSVAVVI